MSEKNDRQTDPAGLRSRAEKRLEETSGTPSSAEPAEDPLRLLHELQVHRIELEMQVEELRQARDAEAAALRKYTDLYDFAPVGYASLDYTGAIRSVNLTGSVLIGIERARLIGRRFRFLVADKSRPAFAVFLEKVFTSRAKEVCEVALLKEDDSELFVQIEGVAAAAGEECRIALIDITGRKRTEKELLLARKTAEALRVSMEAAESHRLAKESVEATSMIKNRFFSNMSHELRTPMAGILGMLQVALNEELAPAPREYVETALNSARSLLHILNDILDMAKFEAGKFHFEEQPFSLQQCLTEAVDIVSLEVRLKGLEFSISVAEDIPETMIGDHMRLRQILLNLIGNAVKFTEAGKVELRVTSGSMTSDGKREITFAVTDTGIGIPDDKKKLIFQTFSQVDESHSRMYGGTGLGLAICREIVELMGGTISFKSEEGVGSTFSFTIPLEEAGLESDVPEAAESPSHETMTAPEGERIPHLLLAEDDPNNRKALGLLLQWANFSIDFAEDGLQAVEMWERGEYDLVLMDIQMPHMNGFEATRAIRNKERERGGHIPIVAMTAHAFKEDEERCLDGGMDHYISKPIDIDKCVQLIRQIIGQKSCGAGR